MNEIITEFLTWIDWNNDIVTIADLINNVVRLAVGVGLFTFILKLPAAFCGNSAKFL